MGVQESMSYLGDLEVALDQVEVLAVLATVSAPEMGVIHRQGFLDGWKATG